MEMNNLRVESHVAQKNRRHKLRFQHNSGDPTRHHLPQDPQFENLPTNHRPEFGSISYNPNPFPSEIANNPNLLIPQNDQDSGPDPGPRPGKPVTGNNCLNVVSYARKMIMENPQNPGNWSSVISSAHPLHNGFYSNVGSMCINENNSDSAYGYTQDPDNVSMGDQKHQGEVVPAFGSLPFYQNTLQEVVSSVTLAHSDHRWTNGSDQFGSIGNRGQDHVQESLRMCTNGSNWSSQGLSLSLSSVPLAKNELPSPHSGPKPDLLDPRPALFAQQNVGPLGPFTGYATILKNSKYLKPAQELLNESCDVGGHELVRKCDDAHKVLEEEMGQSSGDSGASGRSMSVAESSRPEFHQKKAKLLYMQDEVCRRYKQYHHHMQMVISSFETVAGLSAATPYISLALKAVSRHFHVVKNTISEQLTQMRKTLEDLCSPAVGANASKAFHGNATNASSIDHGFDKHGRSGGAMAGFFGAQPPAWRPQRGLPERAVSVLKAWLFEHFLHPYPSDADKHMLATQTGLTRNQVSNWFINARVRIWKPMVEEIHTLETKGMAETNPDVPPRDGMDMNSQQQERSRNFETLIKDGDEPQEPLWDPEKRYQQVSPAGMDRSFMPYPQTMGGTGPGPISLTLGLRQNAENVQQEQQLRQHFGGQLIHDFVG